MAEWDLSSGPPEFQKKLWLQWLALLVCWTGWLMNYFLTIRTAWRDRVSGVSLISLCNNLAWESVFAIFYRPPHRIGSAVWLTWMLVDVYVVYVSSKFTPQSPADSHPHPLHAYLPALKVLGFFGCLSGHLALAMYLGRTKAFFWGGLFCQVVLSASALDLLVRRGHTRGTSCNMWLCRFIGSASAVSGLFLRAIYWPSEWGWADNTLMRWFTLAFLAMDTLYGVIYFYIVRSEPQRQGRPDPIKGN
ncbi:hypothetical protein BDV19DRAFT_397409 [Aspergillus venezuelensis]